MPTPRRAQIRSSPVRSGIEVCPFRKPVCYGGAERLVGLGFRHWTLGNSTGDISHWERTWSIYSGVCGITGGRIALDALSQWVKSVACSARRPIAVACDRPGSFCRDECLAISMIAACQHQTCPAMRACAFALIEDSGIDEVVGRAQMFADTLASLDQTLTPGAILTSADFKPANNLPV